MTEATWSMPLGIVVRRTPGATRWAKWSWQVTAVLPGAGPAEWRELRREGETVEYHAATVELELFRADAEAYLNGLSARIPSIAVVLRQETGERPEILLATASPYEAQDYQDGGDEQVELVPMTEGLVALVRDFVEEHHEEEVFVKRRRDRQRVDLVEDGIGDARIPQTADVYRAPASVRRRLQ
ncbi:DUF3305 domain-containing protein [Rhodovulum sp. DZ06]|uniref:DUF3305 domain-containing protein n=1 Tax=Rhodovulum sp. DZ06 TaxID=3425126 RepID=UPI003D339994